MQKKNDSNKLFDSPFSKEYWMLAAAEFKDLRMLMFAALMIALRVALKAVKIPIAASIDINTAFIANAFGAAVYGPVVAIAAAAVSDTLGCILVPNGTYYFPFIFTEIASSLIFALFLYRAEISIRRITLSRFCICFFVNIVMTEPIMVRYYELFYTRAYAPFELVRIVKNLVMFPIESVVLTVLFRSLIPPFQKLGFLHCGISQLKLDRKHVILLVILFLAGTAATAGYAAYNYNTTSFSASYSAQERLEKNKEMNAWVTEENPDESADEFVTIIESARSKVFDPLMTYELAVYRIDVDRFREKAAENPDYTLETLHGYSKSKAAKDDALLRVGSGTAITNKHTGEKQSLTLIWNDKENEVTP